MTSSEIKKKCACVSVCMWEKGGMGSRGKEKFRKQLLFTVKIYYIHVNDIIFFYPEHFGPNFHSWSIQSGKLAVYTSGFTLSGRNALQCLNRKP